MQGTGVRGSSGYEAAASSLVPAYSVSARAIGTAAKMVFLSFMVVLPLGCHALRVKVELRAR